MLPRSPGALFDKRALGACNHLLRRSRYVRLAYLERALVAIAALKPELVLCTGDISSVGSPEELRRGCALLEPLRQAFGPRFAYIPGNHDAYVTAAPCRRALEEAFAHLNSGRWRLGELPLEWGFGGLRLLLVDGARPMPWFSSAGSLDAAALAWLKARLEAPRQPGECRVVMSHFPLRQADGRPLSRRRRLDGAEMLWGHLQGGRLDLVLSGHIHRPFARWQADGRGEVCAGSLTLEGSFNVVDWIPGQGRFRQFFVNLVTPREPRLPVLDATLAPVS